MHTWSVHSAGSHSAAHRSSTGLLSPTSDLLIPASGSSTANPANTLLRTASDLSIKQTGITLYAYFAQIFHWSTKPNLRSADPNLRQLHGQPCKYSPAKCNRYVNQADWNHPLRLRTQSMLTSPKLLRATSQNSERRSHRHFRVHFHSTWWLNHKSQKIHWEETS